MERGRGGGVEGGCGVLPYIAHAHCESMLLCQELMCEVFVSNRLCNGSRKARDTTVGGEVRITTTSAYGQLQEEAKSISMYLEQVELLFSANKIMGEKQVTVFLSSVGRNTYTLLQDLLAPAKPQEQMLRTSLRYSRNTTS